MAENRVTLKVSSFNWPIREYLSVKVISNELVFGWKYMCIYDEIVAFYLLQIKLHHIALFSIPQTFNFTFNLLSKDYSY